MSEASNLKRIVADAVIEAVKTNGWARLTAVPTVIAADAYKVDPSVVQLRLVFDDSAVPRYYNVEISEII